LGSLAKRTGTLNRLNAMRILLVEPFLGGSHKQWAEQWSAHSQHTVDIVGLPGRYWKWRMIGSAPVMVQKMVDGIRPDLLVYSSMANVAAIRGLLPADWQTIPSVLYMHENQLVYPTMPKKGKRPQRQPSLEMIHAISCLAVDRIFFNSEFHRNSFLEAIATSIDRFPDYQWTDQVPLISDKSEVLYVGIEAPKEFRSPPASKKESGPPVILWNHRWDFDKAPRPFFQMLYRLQDRGVDFQLIVLGASNPATHSIFTEARNRLARRIIHWGFVDTRAEYYNLLWQADVVPVTSLQEFFGISVLEAVSRLTYPLLPNRLSYPEHIPLDLHSEYLYSGMKSLEGKLTQFLAAPRPPDLRIQQHISRYYWPEIIGAYDHAFEKVTSVITTK